MLREEVDPVRAVRVDGAESEDTRVMPRIGPPSAEGIVGADSADSERPLPIRLEYGGFSPFFKLPFLYCVLVDLRKLCPGGAGGKIGLSSLAAMLAFCIPLTKLSLLDVDDDSSTRVSS